MSNIIDSIKLSGVTYTIQGSGGGGNPTVELTQAEYDALVTAGTVSADTYYIITDASGGDLSNYMSSAQTMSAITEATSGKVDSNVYTAYTASTDTAIQGKQDTLVSGTNIKTINNTSILGSGNIDIQGGGGGKAIEAGRGISITTGETADTVSFDLPISAGSQSNSVVVNYNGNRASGWMSFAQGRYTLANNQTESAFGNYNMSSNSSNSFGNSGNTLFTVGNGEGLTTAHNSFEIRQNGDIYIADTNDTSTTNYWEKPMIKLQDNLGGGGGEGTVSALTETNPTLLKADYSIYYTASTIDTIYLISKFDNTFYNYYTMGGYLSDDGYFEIYTSGNENGITSVSASTAFTSTITDGIAEIKFVSPLTLKQIWDLRNKFLAYYFPPTPYTSGSTSEVVEGAVYDSLRKLSLDVLQKDGIHDYYIYTTDNGFGFNLSTDKNYYSGNIALASPTINFNGGKLNTQFSSTTASQVVINNGNSEYCTLFHSKPYDDITITFNPSYNGGVTQANFTIYAQISEYQSVQKYFTYDIANNSISWSSSDWNTYFTVVDTLSTDHKLKIIANTGYKISKFNSGECLICGVDHPNPNGFLVTLVTTTSNIHDGQEVIDDLYANKQDKLSAGTNITIVDNVISAEGGGGKAISAGTNISITTGETADTINCTLSGGTLINISNNKINCSAPIRNGTGNGGVIVGTSISTNKATGMNSIANGGDGNTASGQYSYAEGFGTQSTKQSSHSEGWFTIASGNYSHTEGNHTNATNESEHASGKYNVSSSASTTWGDSGNTLFSVGNGTSASARHNAFEIRQNGDIYCSDGTNDVKLQDTITATAANTTALGGLSLVKLTQAEYDALATKDNSTLYVIVN